mmetsp:Transcript_12144/g.33103  ORF Transcript_12144/g.33103 Transcript_12144/m.33103 type:complete len:264 (+) Transcript_12144:661-1452(+)
MQRHVGIRRQRCLQDVEYRLQGLQGEFVGVLLLRCADRRCNLCWTPGAPQGVRQLLVLRAEADAEVGRVVVPLRRSALEESLEVLIRPDGFLQDLLEVEKDIGVTSDRPEIHVVPLTTQALDCGCKDLLCVDEVEHLRVVHKHEVNRGGLIHDAAHHAHVCWWFISEVVAGEVCSLEAEGTLEHGARHRDDIGALRHRAWAQVHLRHVHGPMEREIKVHAPVLTDARSRRRAQPAHVVHLWQPPERELCVPEKIVELYFGVCA